MSPEYIYAAAWFTLVINVIGFAAEPFFFGESREAYNPKAWLLKLILFVTFLLPLCLHIIKSTN